MQGLPGDHVACLDESDGGLVIDSFGVHRSNDRQVIHHFRYIRQQLGYPRACLSVLAELEDRRSNREAALSRRHGGQALSFTNRVGQILVVPVLHLRLVVEQIHLRRRARPCAGRSPASPWAESEAIRGAESVVAASANMLANAATPRPRAPRVKNWRRVSLRTASSSGVHFICSIPRQDSKLHWQAWSLPQAPQRLHSDPIHTRRPEAGAWRHPGFES